MSPLHDYLQTYINDLQQLLNSHSDDEAFINAVKEKWPDEHDLRRGFVIAGQRGNLRDGNRLGNLQSIKDMGGEDTDGRKNQPVGKKPSS